MLPRLIMAAALIVAATFPVLAASLDTVTERGVLRFAVYRDFPPFSHRVGGTLEGADVDLAKAIGEKLGLARRVHGADGRREHGRRSAERRLEGLRSLAAASLMS